MEERHCKNFPYPKCKKVIPYTEGRRGPRPIFCSGACKTAWHRRHPEEPSLSGEAPQQAAGPPPSVVDMAESCATSPEKPLLGFPLPDLNESASLPFEPINEHHIALPIIENIYVCQVCHGSWRHKPDWPSVPCCPQKPLYSPENRPASLLTRDELKARGYTPITGECAVLSYMTTVVIHKRKVQVERFKCLYNIADVKLTDEKRYVDPSFLGNCALTK